MTSRVVAYELRRTPDRERRRRVLMLVRLAGRVRGDLRVRVANPLTWVTEESTE